MSIEQEINNFQANYLNQIWRLWRGNVALPYADAYKRAYTSFQDKLAQDAAFEKMKLELAFSALTLVSGSIFTMAFGGLTAKALAGKVAVDVICRNNMEKAFKAAVFIDSNKTAQFIIDELWKAGGKALTDQTKRLFTEDTGRFSSAGKLEQDPLDIYMSLELFHNNCTAKAWQALEDVKNGSMTASEKSDAFAKVKKSAFCNPPSTSPYANINAVADRIELSFYMRYILNLDHLVERVFTATPHGSGQFVASRKPITTSPSQSNYPKTRVSGGAYVQTVVGPEYGSIGGSALARANELHKKEYNNQPFMNDDWSWTYLGRGEGLNRAALQKAERVLNDLSKKYHINEVARQRARMP